MRLPIKIDIQKKKKKVIQKIYNRITTFSFNTHFSKMQKQPVSL